MDSLFVDDNSILLTDAVFSERINGLKVDVQSVRNSKEKVGFNRLCMFQSHRLNIGNKSLAIVHGTADGEKREKK